MYPLVQIDELVRKNHYFLDEGDDCSYFMEYHKLPPRYIPMDAVQSKIMNFKKKKGDRGYQYKAVAINELASMLHSAIADFDDDTILIPIPPSKVKTDADYDDRVLRMLNLFCAKRKNCDIRELIIRTSNASGLHSGSGSRKPEDIIKTFGIDESKIELKKPKIVLVDDVITTGGTFKACKNILLPYYPDATITGLFLARRIPEDPFASLFL